MTKGNLIGYTTGGLPIYNYQTPQSVLNTVQSLLRQIVEQSESRQIFYFLCLNLVRKNSTYQPIISFGPVLFSVKIMAYIGVKFVGHSLFGQ